MGEKHPNRWPRSYTSWKVGITFYLSNLTDIYSTLGYKDLFEHIHNKHNIPKEAFDLCKRVSQ
jgi:hypothetical protein